ncbi:glutathione S-transferase N-terminal domain-containing protein [Frateuria hangzhouensis]|uniref:glutathione S-transferase N-terminal domain-containing protein n=1 Tax=Frateuria hangzhouensis TaxID=2995589 RepID=UPI0022609AA5|nr:glutathione S-transferase N-terminal domain-containing protein [Frateuria sp. STR12]MCX7513718.1 glutathione S-transferase N-terminal domain-containing protein [Frateuria sp. STR12]
MVQSARSRTVLTLYTTADDIQCHRARLVLAAKGVSYDRVLVDPAKPPEDLIDLNPYGTTPTLVDRDLTLYDTAVVCEFLDERYPHPPLMPIDPLSRARLRLATVRIERDWLPEVDTIRAGGRPADAARKRLREHLLASLPLFKAAKFFLNPEMSLVDCLVAPVVWRLPWLGVELGREGKPIVDYGERLFHSQGYARSLTNEERAMRP